MRKLLALGLLTLASLAAPAASTNTLDLAWDYPAGMSGYRFRVWRSSQPTAPWPAGWTNTITLSNALLVAYLPFWPGTNAFLVTSVNSFGESDPSNVAYIVGMGMPIKPANVRVSITPAEANISPRAIIARPAMPARRKL